MTVAICFRCGEFKRGAWIPCAHCKAYPESEDDHLLSIAMTDHFYREDELERRSAEVKSGKVPVLGKETKAQLKEELRKSGMQQQMEAMQGMMKARMEGRFASPDHEAVMDKFFEDAPVPRSEAPPPPPKKTGRFNDAQIDAILASPQFIEEPVLEGIDYLSKFAHLAFLYILQLNGIKSEDAKLEGGHGRGLIALTDKSTYLSFFAYDLGPPTDLIDSHKVDFFTKSTAPDIERSPGISETVLQATGTVILVKLNTDASAVTQKRLIGSCITRRIRTQT